MNNLSLNKAILIVLSAGIGCNAGNTVDQDVVLTSQLQITNEHIVHPPDKATETDVDIEKSIIRWKGTKMMRTGKHEGVLNLKEGVLFFNDDILVGGLIVTDMKSIQVTDMPPNETIPIRNLTTHLNIDFDTRKFPTSKFVITHVKYLEDSLLNISGKMTIKDVSKKISFTACIGTTKENQVQFVARFTFDRFDWNIGKDGSWLEKKLVDNEIELRIRIITK